MTVFETEKISQRRAAVIAGIALFIMAGCVCTFAENQPVSSIVEAIRALLAYRHKVA